MIFSISWRARSQVSTVDLMAASSSDSSAVSRARSAARAGASDAPSSGGGPSFSICDLTAASCGRSVAAVSSDSERIVSTLTRRPPSSSSSSARCWIVFSADSIAPVRRVTFSTTGGGSVAGLPGSGFASAGAGGWG